MHTIGGIKMTAAERRAVETVQDYLLAWGGDSVTDRNCSPKGDGRWVPLREIFDTRSNRTTAAIMAIFRAHDKGTLAGYEIAYYGLHVKAVPVERVAEVEARMAELKPDCGGVRMEELP